jgi:hypothetical protein
VRNSCRLRKPGHLSIRALRETYAEGIYD